MDSEIVAAIIGAGASLAAVYRDEITALFAGGKYQYLKGTWTCTWNVATSPGDPVPQLQDQVHISRAWGALLRGKGVAPEYGEYRLRGEGSDFAVTLSYCGVGDKRLLRGVVILKKETPSRMSGVWCQYAPDGILKSGATVWTKV